MGYPTKVQLIRRKATQQWYVGLPAAVAQAMEIHQGEVVEWFIEDKGTLVLKRAVVPEPLLKKNKATLSSPTSSRSRQNARAPSSSTGVGKGRKRSS